MVQELLRHKHVNDNDKTKTFSWYIHLFTIFYNIHSLTIFYTTTFWLFWSGLFCTRLLSFSTVWCASHKSIDRYCNWLPWLELYLIIKFAHKLEVTFCALLVYDTVPLLRHQNTQGQGQVMLQQWVLQSRGWLLGVPHLSKISTLKYICKTYYPPKNIHVKPTLNSE